METQNTSPTSPDNAVKRLRVKIFGVGSAGITILDRVAREDCPGAVFTAVNVGELPDALPSSIARLSLETKLLRGLGSGGDPERGRQAAEENFPRLKEACAESDVIFLIAGLGGGAGTGITPVLARAARESGALAVGFVTLPFDCEGNRRKQQASQGLEQLKVEADGVICLPNQKVCKLIDENTSLLDTFRTTAQLLAEGVRGVWRLLMHRGLIDIHFDELSGLLRDRRGEGSFAVVEAAGTTRARDTLEKLFAHPLLDGGEVLKHADAVLVSLMGGPDLTMADVNRVMEAINQHCARAQVIMGAAVDESFSGRLAMTVIATRHGAAAEASSAENTSASATDNPVPELDTQLLDKKASGRSASRFVPPAPTLTPDQREQILLKQSGGRARRSLPRMRQGNLPLEIVNKGRFDKTEPTVHKGEDLDVPTYIRRGISLN